MEENHIDTLQRRGCEDMGIYTFPQAISLKMIVIERLENELANSGDGILNFTYYATGDIGQMKLL